MQYSTYLTSQSYLSSSISYILIRNLVPFFLSFLYFFFFHSHSSLAVYSFISFLYFDSHFVSSLLVFRCLLVSFHPPCFFYFLLLLIHPPHSLLFPSLPPLLMFSHFASFSPATLFTHRTCHPLTTHCPSAFQLRNTGVVGIPLLVMANKQDLPEALPTSRVSEVLNLAHYVGPWHLQPTCATTSDGLYESCHYLFLMITLLQKSS